jgi:peroxiredoxin
MRARITPLFAALTLAALPGVCAAQDATANLTIVPEGGSRLVGGYAPIRLALTAEKPAGLTKAPEMAAPMYGLLKYGASSIIVALDQPEGKPSVLYVDSNGNGDLTDDAKPEWTTRSYKGQGGVDLTQYQGSVKAALALGGKPTPVSLGMYMFDPKDPGRAALKNTLLYYRDFVFKGDIALGGKTYPIIVDDMAMSGDFANPVSMSLMIDVNGNGKYERKGEIYPFYTRKANGPSDPPSVAPFNIGGTTYEIKQITGDKLTLQKSAKTVAEVLPAPDQSVGKSVIRFTATTTDGTAVSFPDTFKGKIVLLDFWATWCGPCIAELPNLTAAYEKFNSQGFEVLGISLDQANASEKLAAFCKEKNMPWKQVYDGKFWQAEIAQKFDVNSIPHAVLVDGDTGMILASTADRRGPALRGPELLKTIEAALAKKKGGVAAVK